MQSIQQMLDANKHWANEIKKTDPDYFLRAAKTQNPEVLWIGCADSRVGPEKLLRMPIGSTFVHRNIANIFATNDLNCLAVLEYAVDELKVPNVVVCGHYGCGGVHAAMTHSGTQPVDLWLDQIRFIYQRCSAELNVLGEKQRWDRLAELNVEAQVHNICRSAIIREAWRRGQEISILGLIYDIHDGHIKQMGLEFHSQADWDACYGSPTT